MEERQISTKGRVFENGGYSKKTITLACFKVDTDDDLLLNISVDGMPIEVEVKMSDVIGLLPREVY